MFESTNASVRNEHPVVLVVCKKRHLWYTALACLFRYPRTLPINSRWTVLAGSPNPKTSLSIKFYCLYAIDFLFLKALFYSSLKVLPKILSINQILLLIYHFSHIYKGNCFRSLPFQTQSYIKINNLSVWKTFYSLQWIIFCIKLAW